MLMRMTGLRFSREGTQLLMRTTGLRFTREGTQLLMILFTDSRNPIKCTQIPHLKDTHTLYQLDVSLMRQT